MKVQKVQNDYKSNYNPAFKSAIIEKSAAKVIDNMTEAEQKEFNNIIQRIADTKFWDMRLKKVIRNVDVLWCEFVNKKNPKKVYELGIHPLKVKDSKVEIYPVLPDDSSKVERIRFSSPQRAQAMEKMHQRHAKEMAEVNYNSTNLQRLKRWTDELEFLDEAYRYMKLGEVYPLNDPQNIVIRKPSLKEKISDFFGWD